MTKEMMKISALPDTNTLRLTRITPQLDATETETMQTSRRPRIARGTEIAQTILRSSIASPQPFGRMGLGAASLVAVVALAGCGTGLSGGAFGTGSTPQQVHISGNVHGGQNPVAGSTIQLWTVGTTGLRSASTPLISSTVLTDANGNFNITGAYSCTGATQVYITSTGGNPGAGYNSALNLTAALGPCSSLTPSTFIQINEVTTIATAYALAPFAADPTHIGASGSNPAGLVSAFANAALLANTSTGTSPGAGLATGVTVPVAEINTLANIIASCVNTAGPSSTACVSIYNAISGTATDTFGAALAIARNSGSSAVTALYTLNTPTAPFQPSQANTSAPNDYSVAVTLAGSGTLATPYGIAVDSLGNAWVTNESGTAANGLVKFAPNGGVTTGNVLGLAGPQGIAVDRAGNVWIANTAGNSVLEIITFNGNPVSLNTYTGGGISAPTAIALDSAGNAFVTNFNGNSVTGLSNAGSPLSGSPFTGNNNITQPTSLAIASSGNVNVTSSNGSVVSLSNAGVFLGIATDNALQGPVALAIDGAGNGFVTGFTTGTSVQGAMSEFDPFGTPSAVSPVTSGLSSPSGIASDGASVWVANSVASGGLAHFVYGSAAPLSPAGGFGSLNMPIGVAVDASGSVWTANSGSNSVSKFIGIAAPVTTPIAANVGP